MENATENIETESKKKFNFEKVIPFLYLFSELLLFAGVVLYAIQPIIVLCGREFSLPFTAYGVFFTSSVISLFAIIARIVLFLCLTFSKKIPANFTIQKIKDTALGKWEIFVLLLALIWTYISCLVAKNQAIVWSGNWYNVEGFWSVLKYGVIFLDAYLIRCDKLKKLFFNLLVISSSVMGVIFLYTNFAGTEFYFHFTRSIYRNSNHYGYALSVSTVVAVGLSIKERKIPLKVFYLVCFAILHMNMLVSDCLGAFIGEICGITALFIAQLLIKVKKELLFIALGVILIFVASTSILESTEVTDVVQDAGGVVEDTEDIVQGTTDGEEGSGRWYLWKETIKLILKVPIFGKGLDCYYGNDYVNGTLDMPHNEYLQIASNVGLPVLVLYAIAIFGIYIRAFIRRKELTGESFVSLGAGVGYLVSAFFGNTFTYTYPFLLIVLAFGMFKKRRK